MTLYGIWCKDENNNKGDWLHEWRHSDYDGSYKAILAYTSKRLAQKRAAENYGFDTYTKARKSDWVEVRQL